jgi:hypothetical protein
MIVFIVAAIIVAFLGGLLSGANDCDSFGVGIVIAATILLIVGLIVIPPNSRQVDLHKLKHGAIHYDSTGSIQVKDSVIDNIINETMELFND